MIVKCEQCQTRFKIPDEKVTPKGVKVRCTRCGHTFRVSSADQGPTQQVPSLQPGAADPFSRFGQPSLPPPAEVTRPGVFALGVEASRQPELAPPPFPAAAPRPAVEPHDPFDFGSLRPPGASLPSMPAVAPAPSAPPAPAAPAAFDFAAFAAPGAPPPPPAPARSPPVRPQTASPVGGGSFDFGPPPASQPPAADALPAFDFGPPPAPAAPASPAPGAVDGFFAATENAKQLLPDVDAATARAMFDLPAPEDSPAPQVVAPPAPPPIEPPPRTETATIPVTRAEPPPPRGRGVVGVIVNLLIAVLLVAGLMLVGSAFLNEGKVSSESLSLSALRNTFAPDVQFVVHDVSNGLYDTRTGRPIFYVRGEVVNRSSSAVRISVKAELIEGSSALRTEQSSAGQPASPEELFSIDGREALEALVARVEHRAPVVEAQGSAPFVVLFPEFPPDLKSFRVRVSARGVLPAPTAAKE